jgi:two-component system phosphate regulon sensor histidine kinase PhoR
MTTRFGPRFMLGMLAALVAAIGVFVLSGDVASALVTLVGAIIAGLVTLGVDPTPATPAEPDIGTAPAPARLGSVLEAIVEPVLVIANGRVEEANGAARDVLGNHITGQDVRLAIRQPEALDRILSREDAELDVTGIGRIGHPWRLTIRQLGDQIVFVSMADRADMVSAEKMRVDFVANASHELRTPLSTVTGYAETLAEDGDLPVELRRKFAGSILDEAKRMLRLIEDLMSLSRIEADRFDTPTALVSIADVVRTAVANISPVTNAANCNIEVVVPADLPSVRGDQAQLVQVLDNLLTNAVRYGCGPGLSVVTLRAEIAGDWVKVSVADKGAGIARQHLPRLTERFYRVDAARSRYSGGTGLGLAIVKHVMERHRGTLEISSELGQGTTVTLGFRRAG